MELGPLFTDQRWKILQNLSSEKLSPMQLASRTSTTISNVSQQLKLLEAANIIKKEKVRNRDKGKPRTLFSLSKDYAYIAIVMNGFAKKGLFDIEDYRKMLLRIWFLADSDLRERVEKFYNCFQQSLEKIDAVILNNSKKELIVIAKSFQKELLGSFDKFDLLKIRPVKTSEAASYLKRLREMKESLIPLQDPAKTCGVEESAESVVLA